MQYLKDEVKNRILEEALKEFKLKGYKEASMRSIAKNASTSVGNMYKYFENKDDLYETLMGPVYSKIMDYINQMYKVELSEDGKSILYDFMEKVVEIFEENSVELSILLNKSDGSEYENCKKTFIDFVTRLVTATMKYELSLQGKILKDDFIIYVISCSLIESVTIILREKEDGQLVRKLILDIIDIFYKDIINKLEY